ncbi:MAG: CtsR family transcriptional regulator [Bacillota bacterium]
MTLADIIEGYLRELVEMSANARVEITRSELAERFSCVPSQINYVLATRFTPERGFVVESRRGGGGHVRITRVVLGEGDQLTVLLNETIGDALNEETAMHICDRLYYERVISARERAMLQAAAQRRALPLPTEVRDNVRASIMKAMILAILRESIAT